MGLMTWSVPREKIVLPGGDSFTVRGVNLDDITALWSVFGEQLFEIFHGLEGLGDDEETRNIVLEASLFAWLGKIVTDFPEIVCTLIAVVSEEDGELEDIAAQVALTPVTVQVDALMTVYGLTVTEVGASKKFVDHLMVLAAVAKTLMPAGILGIGDSEAAPVS